MIEIWRDIKGYEGKYQVSNTGKIISVKYNKTNKPKELKQKLNKYGYYEVTLSKYNKTKVFLVHKLVAKAFIPNPKKCESVTHIDNNKINNYANNLKWIFKEEICLFAKGKPTEYKLSYKGKAYKNYSQLARDYKMNSKQFLERLGRGWGIDLALKIPVGTAIKGRLPYLYYYYGELKPIKQIAQLNNIPEKRIQSRLKRGWNIYEAAEVPKLK